MPLSVHEFDELVVWFEYYHFHKYFVWYICTGVMNLFALSVIA